MILSAVVASSGGPSVVATGGLVIDGTNGFRYHVFNSSGTFVLNQPRTIHYYIQDSGRNGGFGDGSSSYAFAGAGGFGGSLQVASSSMASGSSAVLVGAGGSQSSFANLTPSINNGGTRGNGAEVYRQSYDSVFVNRTPGQGGSGSTLTLSSPWTGTAIASSAPAQAGGGGGGGGASLETDWYVTNGYMGGGGGGSRGGAAGGAAEASNYFASDGQSANTNSGGGGGGGGAIGHPYFSFAANPGVGGSGRVIVAYSLT